MPRATSKNNVEYVSNGISMSPAVPSAGDKARIVYDGLLSKSGATDLYARVGFGSKWDNLFDYKMSRSATGFETTINVADSDTLNLCFKDCANNWDNNSGRNYTFDVTR